MEVVVGLVGLVGHGAALGAGRGVDHRVGLGVDHRVDLGVDRRAGVVEVDEVQAQQTTTVRSGALVGKGIGEGNVIS